MKALLIQIWWGVVSILLYEMMKFFFRHNGGRRGR